MYNRYIPQNDGSYRRRSIPDPTGRHAAQKPSARCEAGPKPEQECSPPPPPPQKTPCSGKQNGSALGFLKNLLPGDFDTGDLLIVLLLILMAGDCQEDQNWAWLTLALYLFL